MHLCPKDAYGMEPSRTEDYDAVRLQVIRRRWDRKADHWDADLADQRCHLNQDDAYRRFFDAADAVVAARESFCRDRLLVDLACGTGLVLAHFADRFDRALGVDISPRMLAAAAARRLPRVELLEASCFELAGRTAPSGAVLSRGILLSHYGHRWVVPLLRQVHEVLLPDGGFAILDFLNSLTRHDYPANPDNKTYYTARADLLPGRRGRFPPIEHPRRAGPPRPAVAGGAMNPSDVIYLDHNATTPLDEAVLAAMLPLLREQFGNPASGHVLGRAARDAVQQSRSSVAETARRPLGPDRLHRLGDRGQ